MATSTATSLSQHVRMLIAACEDLDEAGRVVEEAALELVKAAEASDEWLSGLMIGSITNQASEFRSVSVGAGGSVYRDREGLTEDARELLDLVQRLTAPVKTVA